MRPRDTRKAVARSGTYSRFVSVLRWVLPLSALGSLVVLVAWPLVQAQKWSGAVSAIIPNLVVEKLHFTGLDAKEQPFSLDAAKALQTANTKNVIDLEKPQGEIALNNGAWVAGRANYGRFDQTSHRLWLGGDVQLYHDQGYAFATNEAQVDLTKNIAWGEKPVIIHGAFGEIHGEGFRLLDGGSSFIVTGHATAHLNLRTLSPSDKPSVGQTAPP